MVLSELNASERLALDNTIAMYKKLDALVLKAPVLEPATKEMLERLLRNQFDDKSQCWLEDQSFEVLAAAHELGLDCAAEMLSDFESNYIPFWLTRKNTRHAG